MPGFETNPAIFSKQRLKSELISHKVKLPPPDSEKHVYMELYMKHVGKKTSSSPDFSSDEEERVPNRSEEEERRDEAGMVDLSLLTDDQLKHKLLQYGIKPGPIVGSTRGLYERKLQRLMTHHLQRSVNNKTNTGKYSDSEEDEDEENEEDFGAEEIDSARMYHTETGTTRSTMGPTKKRFYPQCFAPPVRQIENRLSPQSKPAELKMRCSQAQGTNKSKWQLSRNTMSGSSLYVTHECAPHQKQTTTIKPAPKPVTDVLMEMFPEAVVTPTGITATKRRSIKGAAGRPVQFKYPETPVSPATLERREIQQRLVPLWVQIVVFLLVTAVLLGIYLMIEELPQNPFNTQLASLESSANQ